jgi:predicted GNAT superfamily acetyltransferase
MTDLTTPRLRDARPGDLARVVALNAAAVPHVNGVPRELFERFLGEAAYFRVAEWAGESDDGGIDGFLVALGPDADYDSPNFLWFRERYESFLYIDRIVVDETARGLGLGTRFYRDLERVARERSVPQLTCEVNLRPPNEGSLRFHERFGFERVGRQETEGGAKEVALMTCGVEL